MMDFSFTADVQASGVTFDAATCQQASKPPDGLKQVGWACDTAHARTFFDTEADASAYAARWLASGVWVLADVYPVYRRPRSVHHRGR